MYLNDAIKSMEMNLRSTCMMLEVVRHNQIDKAVEYDWLPMQDHLVQCVTPNTMYDGTSIKDCLQYMEQLYKGLTKAMQHYKNSWNKVRMNEPEVTYMTDMLYGFIGHSFADNYVSCARECIKAYEQTPIDPDEEKNDANFNKWRRTVLDKFDAILKRHEIDITNNGEWSIREGYLVEWLGRKYWKE